MINQVKLRPLDFLSLAWVDKVRTCESYHELREAEDPANCLRPWGRKPQDFNRGLTLKAKPVGHGNGRRAFPGDGQMANVLGATRPPSQALDSVTATGKRVGNG